MIPSFDLGDGYSLILANSDQAQSITEIVNKAYGKRFNKYIVDDKDHPIDRTSAEKIKKLISDPNNQLFVLIHNEAVCGTICYVKRPLKQTGYFGMFSLDENQQKTNVSTQMIKAIENLAKSEGKLKMKIDVSGFAKPLQKKYGSWDYHPTGKKIKWEDNIHWKLAPEFKDNPNSDFDILKKKL